MSGKPRAQAAIQRALPILFSFVALLHATASLADSPRLKLAAALSLTGFGSFYGAPALDGLTLAVEEANRQRNEPGIDLSVADDHSSPAEAGGLARKLGAGDALAVIGPPLTVSAMVTGPIYAQAGLVSIVPTSHGDEVPVPPTTFQPIFNTGKMGAALANYGFHVLGRRRAVVLYRDDAFGRPIAEGFLRVANQLGLDAAYHIFSDEASRARAAEATIADAGNDAEIVLGMLAADAVPLIKALRRGGLHSPVLAPSALAGDDFADLFAREPEETHNPGFFTDDVYAASPLMFDSANDDGIRFAARFKQRFGRDPSWSAVQGYDSALLAIAAMRAAERKSGNADLAARRRAVREFLVALDSPEHALAGVTGPLWFTPRRARDQAVRIGRFHGTLFQSAPLQIVPVADPDPGEIASGALFETEPGRYARLQRVVQTGLYVNLIPRVDVAKSSFGADFYLWLRYARDAGPGAADPVDIAFPDMVSGRFNAANPAEGTAMADGTEYRLWRVQGDFRTDFDLHRFPFDRQDLQLRFFNARASSDRIVYVVDRRSGATEPRQQPPVLPELSPLITHAHARPPPFAWAAASLVSPAAYSQLTQWDPAGAQERRDNLVTKSPLGDLRRVGLETPRELSGFRETLQLQRRTTSVLVKTLLPMLLMGIVMYCTLHFPHALTKEKVTVVVTAVLSGAVLLSSVNNQLGGIGYTIAAEYVFYVFFALGLLCVLYVLLFETFRLSGREAVATRIEQVTRVVFLLTVALTVTIAAVQ